MTDFDPTSIDPAVIEAAPIIEYKFDEEGHMYAVARVLADVEKVVYVAADDYLTPVPEVLPPRDATPDDIELAQVV